MNEFINAIEQKILNEKYQVTKEEALALYQVESSQELFDAADRIRKSCCSVKSSICSIINAKTGSCGEDCRYCAQSAHWKTSCIPSPMVTPQKASELSQRALDGSVTRISLVTAGRALTGKDFETGLECFRQMNRDCEGKMALCASFGIISAHQMEQLKAAGVTRYHHNLESGKNYYSHICTTHTYEDRVATVKAAKKAGLEICSGGIIGLGESREDRVDLALAIRDLDVQSVPINILTPIPGTPFENNKPLTKDEILRTFAVFRFIMPSQTIRCAAGRKSLGRNGKDVFRCGANALISGDFLTTPGSTNEEDIAMLERLGYECGR